jgi:hypothetical protein
MVCRNNRLICRKRILCKNTSNSRASLKIALEWSHLARLAPCFCWFLARPSFRPWRWRQYVPPKSQASSKWHGGKTRIPWLNLTRICDVLGSVSNTDTIDCGWNPYWFSPVTTFQQLHRTLPSLKIFCSHPIWRYRTTQWRQRRYTYKIKTAPCKMIY